MAGTGNVDLTMSDSIKESFEDSEPSEQTFKESGKLFSFFYLFGFAPIRFALSIKKLRLLFSLF